MRSSFNETITTERSVDGATDEVVAAREELRLSRLRLDNGLGTNLEVLTSQRDLTQARVDQALALANFNKSQTQLLHDIGLISIEIFNKMPPGFSTTPVVLEGKNMLVLLGVILLFFVLRDVFLCVVPRGMNTTLCIAPFLVRRVFSAAVFVNHIKDLVAYMESRGVEPVRTIYTSHDVDYLDRFDCGRVWLDCPGARAALLSSC